MRGGAWTRSCVCFGHSYEPKGSANRRNAIEPLTGCARVRAIPARQAAASANSGARIFQGGNARSRSRCSISWAARRTTSRCIADGAPPADASSTALASASLSSGKFSSICSAKLRSSLRARMPWTTNQATVQQTAARAIPRNAARRMPGKCRRQSSVTATRKVSEGMDTNQARARVATFTRAARRTAARRVCTNARGPGLDVLRMMHVWLPGPKCWLHYNRCMRRRKNHSAPRTQRANRKTAGWFQSRKGGLVAFKVTRAPAGKSPRRLAESSRV